MYCTCFTWCVTHTLRMSVLQSKAGSSALTPWLQYQQLSLLQLIVRSCKKCLFLFSHMEYCDMLCVFGFCDGNACAAVDEYQRCFPNWWILSRDVFSCIHHTMPETGCLPNVAMQSEREVVPLINTRNNILEMVQRSSRLSTHRIASRICVSRMQVWRTLREEDLHPYHDHRVQHLEPGDPAQRMDLCHWITAHPQLLSNFYSLMRRLLPRTV